MSLLSLYLWFSLSLSQFFNPSFCHLLLFLLSCVAVLSHVAWFPGYDLLCDCAMQSLCPHDFVTLKCPAHLVPEFSVAQWLEHLIGVWRAMGSIPSWTQKFFLSSLLHTFNPSYLYEFIAQRVFTWLCDMLQFIHLFIFLHNAVVQCGHSVSLLITSAYF